MGNRSEVNFVKDYQPGTEAVVELTNARVVDVMNGCFFDQKVSVLIKNGKIISMPGLEDETLEIQIDFSIDLQGKTMLPGLFNVHCHIQMINPTLFADFKTLKAKKKYHEQQVEKNMADCMACGITNIRDAYSNDLRPNFQLREHIQNRELPGPRIMQAVVVGARGGYLSPELKGMKKILFGMLGVGTIEYDNFNSGVIAFPFDANQQQVRDAVDRAIDERGADLIKVGESLEESLINPNPITLTMDQMQTITDQARRRGVQSTIHCVSVDTFQRAVTVGFSSLAHMARDGVLSQKDIDACLNSDCIIEPTLSVGYDMSWRLKGDRFYNDPNLEKFYTFRNKTIADLVENFWVPGLRDYVIAGFNKANLGKYKMLGILNLSKLLAHYSRLARYGIENTKMLVAQGATMACGNDGGIQACTPAMVAHELSIFDLFMNHEGCQKIFNGITAVQTATINSAKSMGIDDEFGSIQTGKVADLAIVDGNPFEDFSVLGKRVDALFMDGQLVINNCGLKSHHYI
ncbi:MAG: amidohydrolase family protein [Desulfobacula sp.]|uniref:amidohydrolase family protein n=1 Tax=Desulfobacula sp. TaxID=2593537 RepID=UPI0025C0A2BE|nr:amidohydrolase family protein [Desulfobacula sp.]MCD4720889.1 amidohydrolase family protein [Desulfobacula sp.]